MNQTSFFAHHWTYQVICCFRRHCHLQTWELFHQVFWVDKGILSSCPTSSAHSIWNIPEHEISKVFSLSFCSCQNNSITSINDLSPSSPSSIMKSDPGCSSGGSSYKILHGHIGTNHTSISDRCSLSVGTIGSWDIVMISGKSNRSWNLSFFNSLWKFLEN